MNAVNNEPSSRHFRLSGGVRMHFREAGIPGQPAVLLLHGFPNSSRMFREILCGLSDVAHLIAPDLPGFGDSDVLPHPSFRSFGDAVGELLNTLEVRSFYLYLHDFGAPVGLHIAMRAPENIRGLIIQNGNAHHSGLGPAWAATKAYWKHPAEETEKAATAHLTFKGTRDQYVANIPADLAAKIPAETWEEDWRVMTLPGRMETQRALIRDYGNHVERFGEIAKYLKRWQPPALMLWGRHDAFFDIAEILSWIRALPRMEAHILDAGHLLLETHSTVATRLIGDFIRRASTPAGK
jgi:pimeloyl-ACP methyl ester carboxylesterase